MNKKKKNDDKRKEKKMKTRKCGVIAATAVVLLMTALLVTNCFGPMDLTELEGKSSTNAQGMGNLKFTIVDPNADLRTILPVVPAILSYGIELTGVGTSVGTNVALQAITIDGSGEGEILAPEGFFDVTVIGYAGAGLTLPVTMGLANNVEIEDDEGGDTGLIQLNEIYSIDSVAQNGTFSYNLTAVITGLDLATADTATMTFTALSIGTAPAASPIDLKENGANANLTVQAGYYNVVVRVVKDGFYPFAINRVAHVYANMTSTWDNAAAPIVLVSNTHDVTFNANTGTGGPGTVQVVHGQAATEPLTGARPTRSGYDFVNWYAVEGTTVGLATSMGTPWNFATLILRPRTIFAGWAAMTGFDLVVTIEDFDIDEVEFELDSDMPTILLSDIEAAIVDGNTLPLTLTLVNATSDTITDIVWKFGDYQFDLFDDLAELVIDLADADTTTLGLNRDGTHRIDVSGEANGYPWSGYFNVVITDDLTP